jgi:hypothetical protein
VHERVDVVYVKNVDTIESEPRKALFYERITPS